MNTSRPETFLTIQTLKIVIAALLTRILQSAQAITRYSYWLLSVFIFFSCQRNLTQTDTSVSTASSTPAIAATSTSEKFILIDTLQHSLSNEQHPHLKIQDKVKRFYIANDLKTKWLSEQAPASICQALIDHLKNASKYGLHTEDYNIGHAEKSITLAYQSIPASSNEIIALDIQLTEMFFLFTSHLREGRIAEPGDQKNIWINEMKKDDHADVALLSQTKNPVQLNETINKLQPSHEQYAKLQEVLNHYRSLENMGNLKLHGLRSTDKIKPQERHAAIPSIRKKLSLTDMIAYAPGQDSTGVTDSLQYDNTLVSAIKNFQKSHGLETDGVIGDKTIKFLNQSFKEKADLIALNMERLRWSPENYGQQYIAVNIPEYKLRIYEKEKQTLEMKVIVGSVNTPSPVFHDSLEHMVFSPTWTVPASIMKGEIFARLKKDANYYTGRDFTFYKNGVEIDPSTQRWDSAFNANEFRVVQKPGRDNALGLVKFIMPNHMNVYLHDTPDHSLFGKSYRALSHGCIRLDDPAKFAQYLLQEYPNWNSKNIQKAMKSGKPEKISFTKYYQVHLQYNTVWVDEKGQVNFREDIYGHDKRQLQQLNAAKKSVTAIASL